jgi:hypothetical protein
MPHEKAEHYVRPLNINMPPKVPETKESTSEVSPRNTPIKSSTGLASYDDFISEAEVSGVLDEILRAKIGKWFDKLSGSECSAGMVRMQCNNLLKSALKRNNK